MDVGLFKDAILMVDELCTQGNRAVAAGEDWLEAET
jgi:hypothetical protein